MRMMRWMAMAVTVLACAHGTTAQTVEKVLDFTFSGDDSGSGVGSYAPLDRFTVVGTSLWFTTSKGGTYDAGTIARLDLATTGLVTIANLDNTTGKASESPLLVISNEAYFTTVNGGAGNKGTLAKVNLTNFALTVLHDFATNGLPTGATPRGGLTRVGDMLYGLTSLGGSSNRGVIYRHNLTNGATDLVVDLDGSVNGGQAFDGFLAIGDALYFTTFSGGSTMGQPGLPLGAGTLSRLTFGPGGTAIVTRLIDLPAGHTQFPAHTPTLVGTNHLYFTTVGPNAQPGAIVRYDLDTGYWTNAFNFVSNLAERVLYGRQPGYNGLLEWQGELYFMTRLGGSNNVGVLARYSPASNTVTKLLDLTGTNGLAWGSNSGSLAAGTLVEHDGRFFAYYPITAGGAFNFGTILRIRLPAPALHLTNLSGDEAAQSLTWAGGYAPFAVEVCTDPAAGVWTNVASGLTNRSVNVPTDSGAMLLRVLGEP